MTRACLRRTRRRAITAVMVTSIKLAAIVAAPILGGFALAYVWLASQNQRRGDRSAAQADATMAVLAIMVGVVGLFAVRLLLS